MDYTYIVTEYGCNSGAHDMWPPQSKLFTNYNAAYQHFLKVSPPLDDPENQAKKFAITSDQFTEFCAENKDYIIIELRVQTPGYLDGLPGISAKRPRGAILAATKISK